MLNENDLAPDFELAADDGSNVRLSDLRGQKVILFFYPKANTSGCTVEACEFRDLQPDFQEQGALILGISPDTVEDQARFRADFELPYRLLADADHAVAEAYGVWKQRSMYGRKFMGVERTTFLIDEDGRIAKVFRKVTPKGHAQDVLQAL